MLEPTVLTPTGVLDSGYSGIFPTVEYAKQAGHPNPGPSNTLIAIAVTDKRLQKTNNETCLLYEGIPKEVLGGQTVPGFRDSLVKCRSFADTRLIIVLHPYHDRITIHEKKDIEIRYHPPPVVRGKQELTGNQMQRIPLQTSATVSRVKEDETIVYSTDAQPEHHKQNSAKLKQVANNIYKLPSTVQAIRNLHTACGFHVKSTWVNTIRNGNYVGWSFLTVETVNRHSSRAGDRKRGSPADGVHAHDRAQDARGREGGVEAKPTNCVFLRQSCSKFKGSKL